jgi:hypothetical protein
VAGPACAQARPRQASPAPQQRQSSGRVVEAGSFQGADIGARINAADRSLGAAAGEIVARGGGRITTQIVVSANHTLRLTAGTYAPATEGIPVLLGKGASLVGDGWESILLESTAPGQFTVVSAQGAARRNGDADSGISVRDIQIKGANPGFNSAPQAVSLGNCAGCAVEHVWINSTRSIGIQLGGSAQFGNFASNSRVTNCRFTSVASQNLALVNGSDITFENNRFENQGQEGGPGSTAIDLEVNGADDRLERVVIRNNVIDTRTSTVQANNGIVVQATSGTTLVGPVLVEGNTIYGGNNVPPNITNKLSIGIYAFGVTMKDVTIRNNRVTRTGQSGIRIEGTRYTVLDNQFTDVGGGGTPGFVMADVSDSRIEGNTFTYTGVGPGDSSVVIEGSFSNSTFRNNTGWAEPRKAK